MGMKSAFWLALVVSCFVLDGAQATNSDALPAGVEVREYTGWKQSVYLNASERPVQMVMIPQVGGRIVHFSLNGENILFENTASLGKTLLTSVVPLWVGGYQCDFGPEMRGIPEHSDLSMGTYGWEATGKFAAKSFVTNDPVLGVSLEKQFLLAPDSGDLGLIQKWRNTSATNQSYCLWDRTACKNGGYVFFPVNKKSRFKAGWSIRYQAANGKYFYESQTPYLSGVRVIDGVLVAQAIGMVTKIGADSDAGWMAYTRGNQLFIKYFPYYSKGRYTESGNSVELYFDQQLMEFGPVSPETELAPGGEFAFPEKWVLIGLKKEITSFEEARKLVKKIGRSPFAKIK